ncbi:histidine kinase [Iamia majanohamensis]|uniref:histidine kinase n=1 Tax=Iamia majanohamensis TaxID=467976 RepID=A0AAE9Y7F4_9ACTN|nr:histidine kinase [Iamia majanohamensis]WCO68104.1 histidine kinase [Iamia majanohamensis]
MLRGALRSLWEEPRVPDPGPAPWWDRVLVAVLALVTVGEGLLRPDVPWPPWSIGWALLCVFPLLVRRSHPLAAVVVAFGAQTVAGLGPELAGRDYAVLDATAVVLLFPYSLCRWASGRDAVVGMAFVLACHLGREPLYGSTAASMVVGAGFLMFPAALGASIRFRATARQRSVEQVRLQEREELARELHDTVAHHVSAIAIQAQAGRAVAAADPSRAASVLEVIEGAATEALAEMREVVGILRTGAAERAPAPGVADIARLTEAGPGALRVEVDLRGDLGHLTGPVDAALYRLAQESITNARRHARGARRVAVRVEGTGDAVRLEVRDDGRGGRDGREPGYGLVGMAERVELLGGTFSAGPAPTGGWTVTAVLPRAGEAP